MKTTLLTAILFCSGGTLANAADAPKLDGKWMAVALTGDGMEIPAALLKEVPWYWTIEGNKIHSRRPGSGGKVHYDEKLALTMDTSAKPMAFDLIDLDKKKTFKCIGKLDGDQLTLCFVMDMDAARPIEFTSPKGSKRMLMVWKRVKE